MVVSSAAAPASRAAAEMYELANGQMTVTAQQSALPFCQGTRKSPSGRFARRDKPVGSLATGTPTAVKLRAIRSFREWCLIILPGAFLQTKQWRPRGSTTEPQRHSCGEHKSSPSLRPTATLTASSSNCRQHEAIGRANSQSSLRCALCAIIKQLRKRHSYEVRVAMTPQLPCPPTRQGDPKMAV